VFHSLRIKLAVSYSFIVLLCLLLAGSAFVYLLRDHQRQIKLNQLSDLAQPIAWQVRMLERAGASQEQVALFLRDRASEMDVRILLVDPAGTVVEDTGNSLKGDQITAPDPHPTPERVSGPIAVIVEQVGPQSFVFIAAPDRVAPPATDRFAVRVPAYRVMLAVPEQSLGASWLELAPSLSFAALVSLVVSMGVAFLLSRSISRPVTEITRASEEMAQGRYEQYIAARSRDEVGRLAEAFNHMASQVNSSHQTLKDFLANVSHELRTPLTSVQGFSQAMLDGTVKSPEEYGEAAQIINDEAARMRRMVEDLLLISKIQSGQLPMDRSRLDLSELLKACVRRTIPKAQKQDIALTLEAEHPFDMLGDEGRLEEVFQNLLDNAVAHTPKGGEITVRTEPTPTNRPAAHGRGKDIKRPSPGGIQVKLHNTGSFIPLEDQPRVFERFYQVDKSRAHSGEGMGLGLAIAQEIVHAHGGTISVESSPETGTTFVVAFSFQQSATS